MLKTYSHLQNNKRKPNEYEIVSSNLLYYLPKGFEVNVPLQQWYDVYQNKSLLKCKNWEQFHDPRETTYTRYTKLQKEQETFIDGILDSIQNSPYDKKLSLSWLPVLSKIFPVLRYPWHGLQMVACYIGQMAPSGRIVKACLFQAADEMKFIQRVAFRMCQIQKTHMNFGLESKSIWEKEPIWQPLREVIEKLLIVYDWSEAFIALNLVLKPMLNELFMSYFMQIAKNENDYLLSEMLSSFYKDYMWHRQWSHALIKMLLQDTLNNQQTINHFIKKWYPAVFVAITPFSVLFENTFEYEEAKSIHLKLENDFQSLLRNLALDTDICSRK